MHCDCCDKLCEPRNVWYDEVSNSFKALCDECSEAIANDLFEDEDDLEDNNIYVPLNEDTFNFEDK